jgi:hypothetical protein
VLRDVVIEKVRSAKSRWAVDLQGLPKAPVEQITIRDCDFRGVAEPSVVKFVKGLTLEDVRVNGKVVSSLTGIPA